MCGVYAYGYMSMGTCRCGYVLGVEARGWCLVSAFITFSVYLGRSDSVLLCLSLTWFQQSCKDLHGHMWAFPQAIVWIYLILSQQDDQWQLRETVGRSVGRMKTRWSFTPKPHRNSHYNTFIVWPPPSFFGGILGFYVRSIYTCGKLASNFPFLSFTWAIIGSNAV